MNQNCKQQLYEDVVRIKTFLGFHALQYGINLVKEYETFGIKVEAVPFKTPGLRGMAAVGEKPDPDIILLNNARSRKEKNFDCAHETMHLGVHRHTGRKTFNCYSITMPDQDPFLEWQANEGAAEFFMPYRKFIPMLREAVGNRPTRAVVDYFVEMSSDTFIVPQTSVRYRLESLKYEILQFYAGVDLADIKILSVRQQKRQGIYLPSLNDIPDAAPLDILRLIEYKENYRRIS